MEGKHNTIFDEVVGACRAKAHEGCHGFRKELEQ
jgi:hypothetical protein